MGGRKLHWGGVILFLFNLKYVWGQEVVLKKKKSFQEKKATGLTISTGAQIQTA